MNRDRLRYKVQIALKRFIDLAVAIGGLILFLPALAFIALAVRLDSPGPVFFLHKRIGKDGRLFNLYKFRTMFSGGDDSGYINYLKELIESERNGDCQGLPYKKMDGDSRITGVGRVLRNYYLDEFPQLVNIIKGEMSLVGPRPHVQIEVDHYTPEQRRRLTVKPGATGLWQVAGKADCTFNELIDLDLEYIDHWSIRLDIQILFRTMALIFQGGEKMWARMNKHIPGKNQPVSEKLKPAPDKVQPVSSKIPSDKGSPTSEEHGYEINPEIGLRQMEKGL